jgi:hypothetical protein
MTIAEKIALRFTRDGKPDGTVFEDENGIDLETVCIENCAPHGRREHATRPITAYIFRDGSGILVMADGWDFLQADCTCGWCSAGDRFSLCVQPSFGV